jgi:hypothetical protein
MNRHCFGPGSRLWQRTVVNCNLQCSWLRQLPGLKALLNDQLLVQHCVVRLLILTNLNMLAYRVHCGPESGKWRAFSTC